MNRLEETLEPTGQAETVTAMPMIAFLSGSAISYIGDMLTALAIPWFVLQTTGSVARTGITAFVGALPAILSAFFGSALVDRLGYKNTSVLSDIVSGLTVMLVPLLYHTVGLAFWQLLVLTFLGGLLKSPGVTARRALVPDLAELARMRLERINSLSDGINRVSGFIGAPLAGVLIVVIGTSNLLWFDAASFFISALLISISVPAKQMTPPVPAGEGKSEAGYLSSLWEGLRFLRGDRLILSFVLVMLVTNMIDGAFFSVVQPAYMMSIFHSAIPFGLIVAALGGSAFVGTLLFGAFGHLLPRRLTFGIGYMVGGALRFWVFLLFPVFPILFVCHLIAGLAIAPVNPILLTVMQERLPTEMRARVFGTISAGALAGIPVGTFLSGYAVTWIGLQPTLLIMAVLYLAATLTLLVNPVLKGMEKGDPNHKKKLRKV